MTFESDYTEGAHPAILDRLVETNLTQVSGYGSDPFTESAKNKIRDACALPNAQVTFITGGTQTNQIVIASLLKPFQGVVSAVTGHVNCHEAGAIECTGHKVLSVPSHQGKIDARELKAFVRDFFDDENHEHMVFPGMVYISFPTEYGTVYKKDELERINEVCREFSLPLFIDGARLGYGLASPGCDVNLPELARLCDVFYIGGTKVGALCGEAVVFTKNNEPEHFVNFIKQHGALLAKGRLLGVQFETLFTDGLYLELGKHAVEMAELLKIGLKEKGYEFFLDSPTNQQFIIIENSKLEELKKSVGFSFWEKYDDAHTVIRFATSWATRKEDVEKLLGFL